MHRHGGTGIRGVSWLASLATLSALLVVAPSASGVAASHRPPMPNAVSAARAVTPLAVPAYATAAGIQARVRPGNGSAESLLPVPRSPGQTPVWGDWWGDGVMTPAFFTSGHWVFYDRVIGGGGSLIAPVAKASYGTRGDHPVVGDWDGDGRTDLGVVRDGRWYLAAGVLLERGAITHPVTTKRFYFGRPGSQPLAGDWDGDGRDGVAAYAAGRWQFRPLPGRRGGGGFGFRAVPGQARQLSARAVAGDFDGDGRDSVGLVRGSTWRLRSRVGRGSAAVTTRVVPRPEAAIASPWPTTAGPRGASCPTARVDFVAPVVAITPTHHLDATVDPTADPDVDPTIDAASDVRVALGQAERFLLGSDYAERWSALRHRPYLDALARSPRQEDSIRRPAMAALAVAIGLRTDAYDVDTVGRTRQQAARYVDHLVRSIACQHASVTPHGWGWGWQTAHWANLVAEAAWLLWDDLAPQTQGYVSSMLLSEADFQLTRDVDYWRDKFGAVTPGREGNSGAEEVAWNAALLDLASTMAPGASRAPAYRAKAVELQVASYSIPADLTSTQIVNGVSFADRLEGSNALPDGTVINHHRVHPDYMGNIQHLWWSLDFAGLADQAAPESALAHAELVYGAFSSVDFVAGAPSPSGEGTFRAPGGIIYRHKTPSSTKLYYPETSDFGTSRWTPYVSLDAHAAAYGLAPDATWPAGEALAAHAREQLRLVAASGADDGRTFSLDQAVAEIQDRYLGREEYAAQQLATGWLAVYLASQTTVAIDTGYYPVPPDAELGGGDFHGSSSSRRPVVSP